MWSSIGHSLNQSLLDRRPAFLKIDHPNLILVVEWMHDLNIVCFNLLVKVHHTMFRRDQARITSRKHEFESKCCFKAHLCKLFMFWLLNQKKIMMIKQLLMMINNVDDYKMVANHSAHIIHIYTRWSLWLIVQTDLHSSDRFRPGKIASFMEIWLICHNYIHM